jgi:hypothetical protein
MFNKLFAALGHITQFRQVTDNLESLLSHFEEDYIKDKDAKNAAISAVIEILEAHKDK